MSKKRKRRKGAGKGSQFERVMCRRFSKWWTSGKYDDIFWRTSNSGGRGTLRSRKNKRTSGGHGDMQAVHRIGQPLLDLVSVEFKKGYQATTPMDLIDFPEHLVTPPQFYTWILQAARSAKEAKVYGWLLVHGRNNRQNVIYMPSRLARRLRMKGCIRPHHKPVPYIELTVRLSIKTMTIVGMLLDDFFEHVEPKAVKAISKAEGW